MRSQSVVKYAVMVPVLTLLSTMANAQELVVDPPEPLADFVGFGWKPHRLISIGPVEVDPRPV